MTTSTSRSPTSAPALANFEITQFLSAFHFIPPTRDMNTTQYKLSQELDPKHQSDVKAVIPLPGDRIATASRDQSVGIWKRVDDAEVSMLSLIPCFTA